MSTKNEIPWDALRTYFLADATLAEQDQAEGVIRAWVQNKEDERPLREMALRMVHGEGPDHRRVYPTWEEYARMYPSLAATTLAHARVALGGKGGAP